MKSDSHNPACIIFDHDNGQARIRLVCPGASLENDETPDVEDPKFKDHPQIQLAILSFNLILEYLAKLKEEDNDDDDEEEDENPTDYPPPTP